MIMFGCVSTEAVILLDKWSENGYIYKKKSLCAFIVENVWRMKSSYWPGNESGFSFIVPCCYHWGSRIPHFALYEYSSIILIMRSMKEEGDQFISILEHKSNHLDFVQSMQGTRKENNWMQQTTKAVLPL